LGYLETDFELYITTAFVAAMSPAGFFGGVDGGV
jgi:hypothetical protein